MKFKAPVDMETAIRIYYQYPELKNTQIRELFGNISSSTIAGYKKAVQEAQTKRGVLTSQLYTVNTTVAYDVWGIDVQDLIERRDMLKKLNLY